MRVAYKQAQQRHGEVQQALSQNQAQLFGYEGAISWATQVLEEAKAEPKFMPEVGASQEVNTQADVPVKGKVIEGPWSQPDGSAS